MAKFQSTKRYLESLDPAVRELIEANRQAAREATARAEKAERQVRDMAIEIKRMSLALRRGGIPEQSNG